MSNSSQPDCNHWSRSWLTLCIHSVVVLPELVGDPQLVEKGDSSGTSAVARLPHIQSLHFPYEGKRTIFRIGKIVKNGSYETVHGNRKSLFASSYLLDFFDRNGPCVLFVESSQVIQSVILWLGMALVAVWSCDFGNPASFRNGGIEAAMPRDSKPTS